MLQQSRDTHDFQFCVRRFDDGLLNRASLSMLRYAYAKTEANQYFYYSLKFNLRDSRHKDWLINYQFVHDRVRLEIFQQGNLFLVFFNFRFRRRRVRKWCKLLDLFALFFLTVSHDLSCIYFKLKNLRISSQRLLPVEKVRFLSGCFYSD